MMSLPGNQTIAIQILPNISRSKGNQTTKLCQLIQCNMRIIFAKNHTQNVVEKLFPEPFLKLSVSWIISLKFYTVFLLYAKLKAVEIYCRPLAFTSYKASERSLELVLLPAWKCFSCYILLTDQISFSSCFYFVRY